MFWSFRPLADETNNEHLYTETIFQGHTKIALIIRTTTKQVWLDLTGRATQPAYVGTTTNHQIALNAPQNPFFTHK